MPLIYKRHSSALTTKMATTEEMELVSVSQRRTELGDKSQFYLDLADKLWVICPPIIIIGGTIGKFSFNFFRFVEMIYMYNFMKIKNDLVDLRNSGLAN